ncbi:hypothetical protein [Leptospira sp. GIMC2001]|uniref:hypothetical protein n=1 Tax=Leptospira sp. GIMC2001 TaxID=1513297 RepID=UPI00234BA5D2|nr:hypothetical protein [Leptospira sp. GIMC2001]WCL50698.1 hypothetical protein O4O04_07780 [Leptospira sp. GIMC2001]
MNKLMLKYLICLIILPLLTFSNCGTSRSYSPSGTIDSPDDRVISDEEIRRAFEAKPQIRKPSRIAWYNLGVDEIPEKIMFTDPNISLNYKIPKNLIEGFSSRSRRSYYSEERNQINLSSLRLFAARAKCDLLIVTTSDFDATRKPNIFSAFNIFIVPIFILPYLDTNYQYTAEILIFDVRNGYLYKEASYESDTIILEFNTIWNVDSTVDEVKNKFIKEASDEFRTQLKSLFI